MVAIANLAEMITPAIGSLDLGKGRVKFGSSQFRVGFGGFRFGSLRVN